MYPSLPFGPVSLPTGPILTLIAFWMLLETAARFGRRLGLRSDDLWNLGLVSLLAALIVARLWNVFQFADVYLAEPRLIFSLRPSGYAWIPGIVTALIVAYLFLLRKALDPVRVLAAFSVGGIAAASIMSVGAYLTGAVVGTPSEGPLAVWYFGQQVHPAGIYRAAGLIVVVILLWLTQARDRPLRTILLAGFGYALVRLITDAFVAEAPAFAEFRVSQLVALVAAVLFALLLAREENDHGARRHQATKAAITPVAPTAEDAAVPTEKSEDGTGRDPGQAAANRRDTGAVDHAATVAARDRDLATTEFPAGRAEDKSAVTPDDQQDPTRD